MLRVAEHFEKSDTGLQRRANEDSYLARSPLFVVADGMGGAQAGEVASGLVAETFARGLPDEGTSEQRLEARVREANRRIHERQRGNRALHGMGTTITAAYLDGDELALAHVGDSRAYLLRDGELTRLTRDHTLVEELVRRGELTEQEAAEHPQRSIITRALGPEEEVEIDLRTHRVKAGDVLLLCSDGLTGMIDESEVRAILSNASSLAEAGRGLVDAANAAGGRDNITVVLFRLEEVTPSSRPAADQPTAAGGVAGDGEDAGELGGQPTATNATGPLGGDVGPGEWAPPRSTAEAGAREASTRSRGSADRASAPLPRRVKALAALGATAIVLGVFLIAGWMATRAVFFLGTNDDGIVTIYRGIPWELPAGIDLYETWYVSGVPASILSPAERERLLDHRLRSRDDASDLIAELELGRLDGRGR